MVIEESPSKHFRCAPFNQDQWLVAGLAAGPLVCFASPPNTLLMLRMGRKKRHFPRPFISVHYVIWVELF